jgi:hypothetical protein
VGRPVSASRNYILPDAARGDPRNSANFQLPLGPPTSWRRSISVPWGAFRPFGVLGVLLAISSLGGRPLPMLATVMPVLILFNPPAQERAGAAVLSSGSATHLAENHHHRHDDFAFFPMVVNTAVGLARAPSR